MAVLPTKNSDLLEFCETHVKLWEDAPTAIGLTAAQVSALSGLVNTARASYENAELLRAQSKGATTSMKTDIRNVREKAADLIRDIKAFADQQTNPGSVYGLAAIPEPAPPSPSPVPGKPDDFSVLLDSSGAVTLSWTCENAAATEGAFFTVSRQLPGEAAFRQIGGTAGITRETRRASFTDGTVPSSAAAEGAKYIVQGFKGIRAGTASDTMTVQFGTGGGGGFGSASIRKAA